jgi:gluconolactonase
VRELVMPAFQSYAPEFAAVLGEEPRLLRVIDVDAHEGPVYVPGEDALYFTALGGQIKRVALDGLRFPLAPEHVSLVPADVMRPNGMCLGREGRLLVCEQGSQSAPARVSAVDPVTGAVEPVVDAWGGLPLNSPNDVVVRSDGSIWFTDPSYGYLQGFRPKPRVGDFVYRYDPVAGRLTVVADSFVKPNGLAFSPDEHTLYVTDSGANQEPGSFYPHLPHHVIAYDVFDGTHLSAGRLFAVITPGFPDGIKTDSHGRVYISSSSGVQVFDPSGDQLGEIRLPGTVNFTFGGADLNVLFITTDDAVWAAVLAAHGSIASTILTSKGA